MKIIEEFDYRNATSIINSLHTGMVTEIRTILEDSKHLLNLNSGVKKQRQISSQVQKWFVQSGWRKEVPSQAVPDMRYDLLKENIPIEIELGHQRLVYPDFFEFLADYSKQYIPTAVMIVTQDPKKFGHSWHCSMRSTKKKIEAISEIFLVPILVIGVNP